jgi:hypothetical protein
MTSQGLYAGGALHDRTLIPDGSQRATLPARVRS